VGKARREGFEPRKRFLLEIRRNALKSPESHEGIQENPRKSKSFCLGIPSFFLCFSWKGLEKFGLPWLTLAQSDDL
jgi:hypothetical protein